MPFSDYYLSLQDAYDCAFGHHLTHRHGPGVAVYDSAIFDSSTFN